MHSVCFEGCSVVWHLCDVTDTSVESQAAWIQALRSSVAVVTISRSVSCSESLVDIADQNRAAGKISFYNHTRHLSVPRVASLK